MWSVLLLWRREVAHPAELLYNHQMSHDTPWDDPGGPSPDPEEPTWDDLFRWEWDDRSVDLASQTGYPLYLQLRDRLVSLQIPVTEHNGYIEEMWNVAVVNEMLRGTQASCLMLVGRPDISDMRVSMTVPGRYVDATGLIEHDEDD